MDVFQYSDALKFGSIHLKTDLDTGMHAIIALHNLKNGPAIGGCRFIEYENTEAALKDAMRLARGMTYKAVITNLPHGGGKSVILRPKNMSDAQREGIFESFGKFVDSLGGAYITAEDSGTNVSDMTVIKRNTDHVLGFDTASGSSGDPSPLTALGVRRGIEAAAKSRWNRDSLDGLHIVIQGVGHVGYYLARELHTLGAKLTVADINQAAVDRCVNEFGAKSVAAGDVFGVECDIFAPCALGGAINDATLAQLRCEVVAGAANNQLAEAHHGEALLKRNILYAPDYAINAGGLINVAQEFKGFNKDEAMSQIHAIYDTMYLIFERAKKEGLPTHLVADRIVEERLYN